ncbi:MAG: hypothetical protein IPG83_14240 [Novosphingobium sp.]|nr:hypothetical protein [Novosphingobium sp.]
MRYLADFVDAREGGRIAEGDSEADVCLRVFGDEASDIRLDWLFRAFNLWSGVDVSSWFATNFRNARDEALEADERLPVFDPGQHGANLFIACCRDYSPERHKTEFPTRLALLLHALLIGECATDAKTMQRLRTVRNLADWSLDEIRPENMGRLIEQTEQIMAGVLPDSSGFNVAQMEDERRKAEVPAQCPDLETTLHALEDHDLLRGRLLAFSLDFQTLPIHAAAFARAIAADMDHDATAAALLAADDYTDRGYVVRRLVPAKHHDRRWREVLTSTQPRSAQSPLRRHCMPFCPSYRNPTRRRSKPCDIRCLSPFLDERSIAQWFDWRFYSRPIRRCVIQLKAAIRRRRSMAWFAWVTSCDGITMWNGLTEIPIHTWTLFAPRWTKSSQIGWFVNRRSRSKLDNGSVSKGPASRLHRAKTDGGSMCQTGMRTLRPFNRCLRSSRLRGL